VPDHSWLSRTRSGLPLEVHDQVFTWVLERLAARGLIKGERIGVDASTMEANAALRTIVRRDNGEGYREMLTRMARESGIETPRTWSAWTAIAKVRSCPTLTGRARPTRMPGSPG
jgi:transposase